MKRCLTVFVGLFVAAFSCSLESEAGILNNAVFGTANGFEDQSRESVFDLDGSGTLTKGDVLVGFGRFDGRSVPGGLSSIPASGPGSAYAAFSTQVLSVANPDGDPWTLGDAAVVRFGATTSARAVAAGLDLSTLTGNANVDGNDIAAFFDNVAVDLVNFTGGASTILDMVGTAAAGSLEFTAEISNADDLWEFQADSTAASVAIGNLPELENRGLIGGIPGVSKFFAGLTADFNSELFAELVPLNEVFPGTLHDIVLFDGDISGAADLYDSTVGSVTGPLFGTLDYEFDGDQESVRFYGTSNNVDVAVHPVPEPSALAVWGMIGVVGVIGYRRRSAKK